MQVKEISDIIIDFIDGKCIDSCLGQVELGLSGGIDSAVVLALAYEALGSVNVHCLMLPYYENSNLTDAIELATNFGVHYKIFNIKKIHDVFASQFWNSRSLENLMARIRMCYLYAEANTYGRLVLGTCNLSEIITGYFTKWGDGAADLDPLGKLPKQGVYELANYWNDTHPKGPKIPQQIIDKKPSADLHPGQTDEFDIGLSYKILDTYLMAQYYNGDKTRVLPKDIEQINNLIRKSKHKRLLIPSPYIPQRLMTELPCSNPLDAKEFTQIVENAAYDCTAEELLDLVRSLVNLLHRD